MQEPTIVLAEDWGAKSVSSIFPKSAAKGIVIHNTGHPNRAPKTGAAEHTKAFDLARSIQHDHMVVDHHWADTGQHFTISRGGLVLEGRHGSVAGARLGKVIRAAHAGSTVHNIEWYGIELEGNNTESFAVTDQQWSSLVELCAWLASTAGIKTKNILGHLQVKKGGTDCPGKVIDRLPDLRTDVTAKIEKG